MTYLKYSIIFFFLCQSFYAIGQKNIHFGERLILGSSLSYVYDTNDIDPKIRYNLYIWDKNIAVNLDKSFYFGLSLQNLYANGSTVSTLEYKKKRHFLMGAFLQYDFLPSTKERLFIEVSWKRGNFCTCGENDPFKASGLSYIGLAGGYDYPINKYISLDLSFVTHYILEAIKGKYAYNQYIIGLNFDLISRKR